MLYKYDLDYEDRNFYYKILQDGSKSGVLISSSQLYLLKRRDKERFQYVKLKENVITDYEVFALGRNSFLHDALNRKMFQLIESGIVKKLVDETENLANRFVNDDDGKVVLTLGHLSIGFQIWLLFLFVAFLCFLMELVSFYFAQWMVRMILQKISHLFKDCLLLF